MIEKEFDRLLEIFLSAFGKTELVRDSLRKTSEKEIYY